MTQNTLIRHEGPHEVKLSGDGRLAESHKTEVGETPVELPAAPPPSIRKPTAAGKRAAPRKTTGSTAATPPATAPAKTRRKPRAAAAKAAPAAPVPQLPARVPADRLWEDDSVVMQRLQTLQQENARLSEQLQRIQHPALSKGFKR